MAKQRSTTDVVEILHRRYIGDDEERKASLQMERINADVARMIYDLRKEVGLTQKELSARVGTTQSVISRLEDADYDGHSLSMLNRIAASLNRRLAVTLVADKPGEEVPVGGRGSRREVEQTLRKVADVEPEEQDRV